MVNSLSALKPIELNYTFNTRESLAYEPVEYANKLSYKKYVMFNNLQDVALSKKNALFLTDTISLSSIFASSLVNSPIGKIPGSCFFLINNNYAQFTGDTVYIGPLTYTKLLATIIPITSTTAEIHANNGTKLQVDKEYPYTVRTTTEVLPEDQLYRQQFVVDYTNNIITFKTTTDSGERYLAYGSDGILRANGLMLNQTVFNSYLFNIEPITVPSLELGYIPTAKEVKYYNMLDSFVNRLNLNVETDTTSDTNLLVSCATTDITNPSNNETPVNIALLKTNFTSTGTYVPQYNE
jgi:hypothetical protein